MDKEDLGPLPQIHPREQNVTSAESDIRNAVNKAIREYGLTAGEIVSVVTRTMTEQLNFIARGAIRAERHPNDPDKPGGCA